MESTTTPELQVQPQPQSDADIQQPSTVEDAHKPHPTAAITNALAVPTVPNKDQKRSKWDLEVPSDDDDQTPRKRLKKEKKNPTVTKPSVASRSAASTAAINTPNRDDLSPLVQSRSPVTPLRTPVPYSRSPSREPTPPPLYPTISGCRSVENYEKLNRIEEGAYGVVYRAREIATGTIVALKKLKLEKEKNGFPITSLREIHTLLLVAGHSNIVNVREIVVGGRVDHIYIVMDFIEHDLKALMGNMPTQFLQSEVKTLMLQLLSACACLHSNWIIHRDLKTSNLLLNNRGEIKVADFGLARRFGSPLGHMTQLVVTLWYRSPELLLGVKEYSTEVDMWSVGCIFAELINKEPLIQGKSEIDQLDKIFRLLGTPSWPGLSKLPNAKDINFANYPFSTLRSKFPYLTESGLDLLSRLLEYDPKQRITAEDALAHPYFREGPLPKDPSLFPTWPSKGGGGKRKSYASPSAPQAAHAGGVVDEAADEELYSLFGKESEPNPLGGGNTGFRLKLG